MTYQEKRSVVNIASTLLVFGFYYWDAFQRYETSVFTPDEELAFWGKTILLVIPISIGIRILLHILFTIAHTVITKEKYPKFEDERDRLIELKSTRNSYVIFGFGFLIAMGLLAFGWPLKSMFIVFIVAGVLSDIVDNLSQLYFHRSGI